MNPKTARLRSYRSLLRMAKVRESQAVAELAKAVGEERERRDAHRHLQEQRDAVARAGHDGHVEGRKLDLARLEMLSMLDAALGERQQRAADALAEAERVRGDRAQANWQAKRYRERVDEQLKETRQELHAEHAAKAQEESIELWVEHREGAT
ncbi:MAG TPA: hypothetical protein VIM98_08805 [Dyella sp.]|uniref:hypothetical protein n=1 Tax=Dyella sp. TaxID=1869338 RepID=UPI002F94CEC5